MQKIDFVIAWVDGNDPKHREKRQHYQGTDVAKDAAAETRFASNDEIYFSIASILKYVPYCGTIYVITDQQRPEYIDEFEKQHLCRPQQIQVVDHQVLFTDHKEYLPTFNSLSIETMLWRIPHLSNYFIYLNDDFFFNADSELSDFLINEKVKIYGHWQNNAVIKTKFKFRQMLNQYFGKKLQPKYTIAQMLSAEMLGADQYYEVHHRPHIIDQKTISTFFDRNPDVLQAQIQHRFRSAYQFLPVGLANQLKINNNEALLAPDSQIAYLKNTESTTQFLQDIQNNQIKFGCIQSLDQIERINAEKITTALKLKFSDFLPSSIRI